LAREALNFWHRLRTQASRLVACHPTPENFPYQRLNPNIFCPPLFLLKRKKTKEAQVEKQSKLEIAVNNLYKKL
jgi:hypothetical protein